MSPKMKKLFLLAGALALLAFTGGCGREQPKTGNAPAADKTLAGTIKEAGSTSVLPLAEGLAIEFMKQHQHVRVETSGGGSGAGIKQCNAGAVELGALSRELKITEQDLIVYPVARDAIAVIVNPANPVSDLTREQIGAIYAGEITDWRQVGGKAGQITVIAREEGSGTRDCFEEKVMPEKDVTRRAILKNSNGEIQEAVSKDALAIGFVSLGYIQGVKVLAIEGVKCTLETCQQGSYPLVRRLYFVTRTIPTGAAKEFIDFARGPQGQQIARQAGFVPLVK